MGLLASTVHGMEGGFGVTKGREEERATSRTLIGLQTGVIFWRTILSDVYLGYCHLNLYGALLSNSC